MPRRGHPARASCPNRRGSEQLQSKPVSYPISNGGLQTGGKPAPQEEPIPPTVQALDRQVQGDHPYGDAEEIGEA